jgi:hypothetical protein
MPSFTLLRRDGTSEVTEYTPLVVVAGTEVHKLALHKDHIGDWVVSDPKSGAAIIRRIRGWFKGCPVSTTGYSKKEALRRGLDEVEALIEHIGSEKFNAVLSNPKPF